MAGSQYAAGVSIPAMMLGFGATGFLVGSVLILRDIAGFKIQQKQAAGLPAIGWRFLRAASLIFVILFAVLALCIGLLLASPR